MEGCILLVTPLTDEGRLSLKWVPHTCEMKRWLRPLLAMVSSRMMSHGNGKYNFTLENTMLLTEHVIQDWTLEPSKPYEFHQAEIFEF
jgi:hypothetical protein